ncbi:hypothetical protein GCM10011575_46660 [Microlunatus endophyticus]|uniref:Uncharacterized protein n=1 Tax=Microlunatus endophyticus TaxID=1716077 RepID=A0A917SJ83_9ACTN|nr:hypothetical protein GCM10011575_46660 [Microlunatus endophyticus]
MWSLLFGAAERQDDNRIRPWQPIDLLVGQVPVAHRIIQAHLKITAPLISDSNNDVTEGSEVGRRVLD